jgi:hypothetical protein
MIFNDYSKLKDLKDKHAFLSPSKPHWLHYDEQKLDRVWVSARAKQKGIDLHALASEMIRQRIKAVDNTKTFNQYVNDSIGFRMIPEQLLFYSENCFGTADAIAFRKEILRISDLKTGSTPTSIEQLETYAALFCLEYKFRPFDINTELRIYQSDECRIYDADPHKISSIMETIKMLDKRVKYNKEEDAQ